MPTQIPKAGQLLKNHKQRYGNAARQSGRTIPIGKRLSTGIAGMVTYPLDEVLFSTLVGLLCRADDWDEIEFMACEHLNWPRRFLPFDNDIPHAQICRCIFAILDPKALEAAFASWVSSLQSQLAGVVAIDAMGCQKDVTRTIRKGGTDYGTGAQG